jgi:hypothetical protein
LWIVYTYEIDLPRRVLGTKRWIVPKHEHAAVCVFASKQAASTWTEKVADAEAATARLQAKREAEAKNTADAMR